MRSSGFHWLRANFAQNKFQYLLAHGVDEREAPQRVSELLEHARIDVTYKYVPKGFMAN